MDNETRQFGASGADGGSSRRPTEPQPKPQQRPKQYIPDPAEQQYYEQEYYEAPQQTHYPQPQYQEPQYQQPEEKDNVAAMVFGALFAIAAVAATVLFFLWRGAAAEANKPPVTQTVTQTKMVTTTETTTRRPSLFGDRDQTETRSPSEPARQEPAPVPEIEIPEELRDAFEDFRQGAEQFFGEQQQ